MISANDQSILDAINNLNEGWAIYSVIGKGDEQFCIEATDDMGVFQSDGQAIKHVYQMALQGSKIHADALDFMHRHGNAVEKMFMYQAIVNN